MNTPFFSFISILILSAVFAFDAFAQQSKETENALLWKVSGNCLTQDSYLYGTIHIICPEELVMNETITNHFNKTQQVYLEMDMDDLGLLLKMQSPKTMNMEKGNSLKKLLKTEEYNLVSAFFRDSLQKNIKNYDKTKPFFTLSAVYPKMLPCKQPASYEVEFLKMAKSQKKEILGLETLDDQLAAVNSISYKEQAEGLLEYVKDFSHSKSEFARLVNAYKAQNLKEFAVLMEEEEGKMEGFEENFLKKRNEKWTAVIAEAASKKPTFFAFGAAHLIGENGMVNLLRNAGYKVEPIAF